MCEALEQMRNEVAEEAAKRAARAMSIQIAQSLIARNKDSIEEIAEITGLTTDEVMALNTRQPA